MISILFWISLICGGLLTLLLLLSIIGGMDLDLDFETGSGDAEVDSGGLGVIKGILTTISVGAWVIRILLVANQGAIVAYGVGITVGVLAFLLLNFIMKTLVNNDENTNWEMSDSLFKEGTVYLKIPTDGEGIVNVNIKGAIREMKARSFDNSEIDTGKNITVMEINGEHAIVRELNH